MGFAKSRPMAQWPTAQGTLHSPWPGGPAACGPRPSGTLHSSHPAVQFRIFVSGILQRMF